MPTWPIPPQPAGSCWWMSTQNSVLCYLQYSLLYRRPAFARIMRQVLTWSGTAGTRLLFMNNRSIPSTFFLLPLRFLTTGWPSSAPFSLIWPERSWGAAWENCQLAVNYWVWFQSEMKLWDLIFTHLLFDLILLSLISISGLLIILWKVQTI